MVFGGYVTNKTATLDGVRGSHVIIWSVDCKDWSEVFETVTVSGNFTNIEDRQILISLFNTFLPFDAGFSFSSTRTLKLSCTIAFDNVTLKDAIDQLAKLSGANWFIKPNKDVYWFAPTLPDKVSFTISSNPNNTTSFGFLNNSLQYSLDSNTIINQVKVINGYQSTGTKQTDIFTGNGSTKTYTLTSKADSILSVYYNDGSTNYVTYGSFVGYTPDKLISLGGNKLVVFNPTDNTITVEGNTGLAVGNGQTLTVEYYYKQKVTLNVEDPHSVEDFGAYPYVIQNKEFETDVNLEALALSLLDQNSYAKPTIRFETTQYGLLPGQLIELDIPELGLESASQINRLTVEDRFAFILESDDYLLSQQSGVGRSFLIQEVSITPVFTPDGFMIVSQVTCGKYTGTLVDSLSAMQELKSSTPKVSNPIPTRLSNYTSDLGEVVVGRATFTDGGTARFNWGTPNGASGVVVGLEDKENAHGAMYVYHGGTVKAKLGYMVGMPMIGTITPSGWGLYTENGYFTGIVAASQLVGGTVTGSLISGGTVTGNLISGGTVTGALVTAGSITGNQITGGTITGGLISGGSITGNTITGGTISAGVLTGNNITGGTITGTRVQGGLIVGNTIIGGTIATSTPPINSSNPGVIMDSTGLYGYGSAGLTFRLSSDPAIKPWFSSGTILDTTYEVNTSAVIRTGTSNPRIQIDNSGIFAYNSAGFLKFSVDAATGILSATDGNFSGSITASRVTGGTLTSTVMETCILYANTINGSDINASNFYSSNIVGGTITGGLIQGNTVSGGTVTGALFTGGTVQAASGNVYLDSGGLNLITTGSYSYGDQRNIKWRSSVGGSIAVEVASSWNGTFAEHWIQAGYPNFRYGIIHNAAYNNSGLGYSESQQYPTQWTYLIDGNYKFQVDNSNVTTWLNIIPDSSANNRQLGNSSNGFRYIYLKDDNGNVRRVSINSSGVLTVT